ncbi:Hypothetical predicted protein [Lynx pardinus]|uniref:Uncharacterized protein n=1 Tax=Lynx pardinus TaxID=191816 RepID=A0A485P7S5_LYNPA|nr:Hypothetical predicted protein [Lynx pardinus]
MLCMYEAPGSIPGISTVFSPHSPPSSSLKCHAGSPLSETCNTPDTLLLQEAEGSCWQKNVKAKTSPDD